LSVIALLYQLYYELKTEVKEKGLLKEVVETIGLIIAVFIAWKALGIFMNTDSPISAIATCSMAQNLMAGDMVLVKRDEIKTLMVDLTEKDVSKIQNEIRLIDKMHNLTYKLNYSVLTECISFCSTCTDCELECNNKNSVCGEFLKNPENFIEKRGNLEISFSRCEYFDQEKNVSYPLVCTSKLKVITKDKGIAELDLTKKDKFKNYSIIVYKPKATDYFAEVPGDITHRAILGIKTENNVYYITKGDHNDRLDLQIENPLENKKNSLVEKDQVNGNIVYSVPYIGYLKLFLSLRFDYQKDCHLILRYH
ncbi:MAG: hypothetical protein N3E37_04305, partial [Candidatus Micrarchaeota archaeon]|nr:hypothetical protein [Candidatus Micrarchaeota archaeon]